MWRKKLKKKNTVYRHKFFNKNLEPISLTTEKIYDLYKQKDKYFDSQRILRNLNFVNDSDLDLFQPLEFTFTYCGN